MAQTQPLKNRESMMAVFYADELRHHGVEGMKWGVMHGPPYPLDGANKAAFNRDVKMLREEEREEKRARKEAQREKKNAILKDKIVRKGDIKAIKRHRDLFTTQEFIDAVKRAKTIAETSTSFNRPDNSKPKKSISEIMNDITKVATTVNQIGTAAITIKNLTDGIAEANHKKELRAIEISSKELANLKLAKAAYDSGVMPKDEYWKAMERFVPKSQIEPFLTPKGGGDKKKDDKKDDKKE